MVWVHPFVYVVHVLTITERIAVISTVNCGRLLQDIHEHSTDLHVLVSLMTSNHDLATLSLAMIRGTTLKPIQLDYWVVVKYVKYNQKPK